MVERWVWRANPTYEPLRCTRHGASTRSDPGRAGAPRTPRWIWRYTTSGATAEYGPRGLSWQEYRLGARILLHIARLPRIDPDGTAPEARTQSGIASALGSSRVSVTQALQSLELGGAIRAVRGHAQNRRRRVKVYQLTPEGEELVRHIRDGMRREKLIVEGMRS